MLFTTDKSLTNFKSSGFGSDKNITKIATECNRGTICVTYDLAIAKIVSQIQYIEKPKLNISGIISCNISDHKI